MLFVLISTCVLNLLLGPARPLRVCRLQLLSRRQVITARRRLLVRGDGAPCRPTLRRVSVRPRLLVTVQVPFTGRYPHSSLLAQEIPCSAGRYLSMSIALEKI